MISILTKPNILIQGKSGKGSPWTVNISLSTIGEYLIGLYFIGEFSDGDK